MACTCIDEMNAELAELNTELAVTFGFGTGAKAGYSATLPTIETRKIEKRQRVGPAIAVPTFCPFCGTRYAPEAGASQ